MEIMSAKREKQRIDNNSKWWINIKRNLISENHIKVFAVIYHLYLYLYSFIFIFIYLYANKKVKMIMRKNITNFDMIRIV